MATTSMPARILKAYFIRAKGFKKPGIGVGKRTKDLKSNLNHFLT